MKNKIRMALVAICLALALYLGTLRVEQYIKAERVTTNLVSEKSHIDRIEYAVDYGDETYEKEAFVYVPDSYSDDQPMDIMYLMHGSQMNNDTLAHDMQPYLDEFLANKPMLVVFPTYYMDDDSVSLDYYDDYPLTYFFSKNEVLTLMHAVEKHYHTYAEDMTLDGFVNSRKHRAFAGYSMGGTTTWDIMIENSEYFYYYLPMAESVWYGQISGNGSPKAIAKTLENGFKSKGYGPDDFFILAMAGEWDSDKEYMLPQIAAIRRYHSNFFTDQNFLYWENPEGLHSFDSLVEEIDHAIPYLFRQSDQGEGS